MVHLAAQSELGTRVEVILYVWYLVFVVVLLVVVVKASPEGRTGQVERSKLTRHSYVNGTRVPYWALLDPTVRC